MIKNNLSFKAVFGRRKKGGEPVVSEKPKKWPRPAQWKKFFKTLETREKVSFWGLLISFAASAIFLFLNFYLPGTETIPAPGGSLTEAVLGQPRFINPIYANSDADRDLTQLTFAGLMKYDENLNIVPDLAQKYEVSQDGKTYIFYLKENLKWQDNRPISADDIIFTVKAIQNPAYKSPFLASWTGVEAEKTGDLSVKFKLQKPYSAFIENAVLKIVPSHIWQNVPPENSPFEIYNLRPVGSGPYKVKEISQESSGRIQSATLVANPLYGGQKPYIPEIKFIFFGSEREMVNAALGGKITGFSVQSEKIPGGYWQKRNLLMPRYFALFFNPEKSSLLKDLQIRRALNYGTDKREITNNIFGSPESNGEKPASYSPVLPEIYGFGFSSEAQGYDPEKAKTILEDSGFRYDDASKSRIKSESKEPAFLFEKDLKTGASGKDVEELQRCLKKESVGGPDIYPDGEITGYFGAKTKEAVIKFQEKYGDSILVPWGFDEGTGIVSRTTREVLNELCFQSKTENQILEFRIATVDQPQLKETAQAIKDQWEKIGIKTTIETFSPGQLEQEVIKPRNYEILLFGEILGAIPDPFPFWHSSQKKDPGLNLAMYENSEADRLLQEIRESTDPESALEKLFLFQENFISQSPAIILYTADYEYYVSKSVKGISTQKIAEPSKRFSGIENWHIQTRRTWK